MWPTSWKCECRRRKGLVTGSLTRARLQRCLWSAPYADNWRLCSLIGLVCIEKSFKLSPGFYKNLMSSVTWRNICGLPPLHLASYCMAYLRAQGAKAGKHKVWVLWRFSFKPLSVKERNPVQACWGRNRKHYLSMLGQPKHPSWYGLIVGYSWYCHCTCVCAHTHTHSLAHAHTQINNKYNKRKTFQCGLSWSCTSIDEHLPSTHGALVLLVAPHRPQEDSKWLCFAVIYNVKAWLTVFKEQIFSFLGFCTISFFYLDDWKQVDGLTDWLTDF